MDDITFDSDDTFGHTDPIAAQGGLGGGGDISPVANPAALRRSVWERSGSGLPTYSSSSSTQPQGAPEFDTSAFQEAPVPSSLPVPTPTPTANLKHLHIVHRILSRRMRSPQTPLHCRKIGDRRSKRMRSRTVDARSSIEAGGLPGHSETIYSLKMIRHRMSITMTQARPDCRHRPPDGPFQTMMTLTGISPGPADAPVIVSGRDWLLSGSRDRTLRLWQMACPEPKVVKVFHGGHTGSVLSHFVVKLPDKDGKAERVMAVSGGSDGKICLWDVEHGDGSPEKVVKAHHDSVLCVAGDDERIVSCSKGGDYTACLPSSIV